MAITMTPAAAQHVRRSLDGRGKGLGIRLGVRTSGCSGLAYVLEFVDELTGEDVVFEEHGVKVITDPKSLVYLDYVEGESLIMALKDLAVSSGSACTSASLEPSYVLRALGRNDELAHSSIRFSFGRFTTEEEVDYAAAKVCEAVNKLRELSPLWDMFKDGVDLSQVQWQAH